MRNHHTPRNAGRSYHLGMEAQTSPALDETRNPARSIEWIGVGAINLEGSREGDRGRGSSESFGFSSAIAGFFGAGIFSVLQSASGTVECRGTGDGKGDSSLVSVGPGSRWIVTGITGHVTFLERNKAREDAERRRGRPRYSRSPPQRQRPVAGDPGGDRRYRLIDRGQASPVED